MSEFPSLDILQQQEDQLQFDVFNHDTALALGKALTTRAQEKSLPLAIEVFAFGQTLYFCALQGTNADNSFWIERKRNSVLRFGHSSLYMGESCRQANTNLVDRYQVDAATFAEHGGSFPIRIGQGGVIGAATVSGLPQVEDHEFVTELLQEFLQQ